MPLDASTTRARVDAAWESLLPTLRDYVAIPAQSPAFDPGWRAHGHLDRAADHVADWIRSRQVPGSRLHVVREDGRTPLLLLEVDGSAPGEVLLYGHLDKQPPFEGWEDGLGAWTPVLRGDRLYGRGGADDGYAAFAAVTAIEALKAQGAPHPRLVLLVEACEESGSPDLPYHVERQAQRIGSPGLVICLDSGCGDYERLWLTTSLRGMLTAELSVEVLREGVHSGDASGIVPSTFRIARQLLDRLEDSKTGRLRPDWMHVEVPEERRRQATRTAEVLGRVALERFPWVEGARPAAGDPEAAVLARTWSPTLCVTGQAGIPDLSQAGNVLRPRTALKLSLRLPPTLPLAPAVERLAELLESDPPHGARVKLRVDSASPGWNAPPLAPWLEGSIGDACRAHFGHEPAANGEGGSIPFMAMLGERFPEAQFLITGVLGPGSNAHGPNEFLHLPTARRLTACVAHVLADSATRLG